MLSAGRRDERHGDGDKHSPHIAVGLATESDEPITIARAANALLPKLRPGTKHVRAAVVLTALTPKGAHAPLELFQPEFDGRMLGETLDSITNKLGPRTISIGRGGLKTAPGWTMKREMLSRRATTHWDELCEATA